MTLRLNYFRVWSGLIFLLAGFPALCATNSGWFTRVWQIDDGLPDNNINRIVQGADEYLWLVTPVGLIRFDGVNFTPVLTVEEFNGPYVREITCSRQGVLWVAFAGGRIIGLNPNFSTISLGGRALPNRAPVAMATDDDGVLYLGYFEGIYRAQGSHIKKLSAADGVPPGLFHTMISDGLGNIWLSKGNQICCFQNGKFRPTAIMDGVQYMAATRTNAIWLGANAHLFSCGLNGKLLDCGAFQHPSDAAVVSLLEDHTGAVWIGTHGNGLFHYSQSRFERVETSHSSILSLAEDHEGDIWAGTGGGGLNRITRSGVQLEALENNQVHSQIQSICQDAAGQFWGATLNSVLVSRTGNRWKPALTNAWFAEKTISVAADRNAFWVGTGTGRLVRIVNNQNDWETNLGHGPIRGLFPAAGGDIWIVGSNVLERLHDEQIENITLPRQVRGVYAITEDAAGKIWAGANGILLRLDGTNIEDMTSLLPISGRPVCCLCGTEDGSVWIGSRAGGLMRFKNGQVGQVGLSQGLANNTISQIVADKRGWLWFGSSRGIFKLRQREVDKAMTNHGITLRPIIYGKNEGLISQEAVSSLTSPFILPRAILASDGDVFVLTHTGVVEANPNFLVESTLSPPISLTLFSTDGQITASQDGVASSPIIVNLKATNGSLEISPSHRHLEFYFTAFHFHAPENLRFRYQLAGYDNDWIDAGTERSASYSRLAAGNYEFRAQASVGDGPWSEPAATVSFEVVPFFWMTWWFRAAVLLAFTMSLIAIVRYVSYRRLRMKLRASQQQSAVERERGRIARDIHDDLGNRLTEIQLLTGLAQRNREIPKDAGARIGEISSAARQATDALDEIVWAINPRNDTLPHLINYLGQFTTDFLRTAGIQCRVDLPENPPAKSVSAEVRHNLFLVIKESLNNIARHSAATEVSILILVTDKSLSIIVKDNGRGFNGAPGHSGADGLDNMRRRIADIGGEFQITSKPGAGTCISLNGLWLAGN
jgi:signal transduction histidine kinase/ligand-binding sensor domain-containing protein